MIDKEQPKEDKQDWKDLWGYRRKFGGMSNIPTNLNPQPDKQDEPKCNCYSKDLDGNEVYMGVTGCPIHDPSYIVVKPDKQDWKEKFCMAWMLEFDFRVDPSKQYKWIEDNLLNPIEEHWAKEATHWHEECLKACEAITPLQQSNEALKAENEIAKNIIADMTAEFDRYKRLITEQNEALQKEKAVLIQVVEQLTEQTGNERKALQKEVDELDRENYRLTNILESLIVEKEALIRKFIKYVFIEAQKGGGYTEETENHFFTVYCVFRQQQNNLNP